MKQPVSILLIDDDDNNNFLNQRLFSKMGIAERVKVQLNGQQAFNYLYNISQENYDAANPDYFKPDLILLDINMPVMDGYEFLNLYNNLPEAFRRDIKMALLATSGYQQDIEQAEKYNLPYLVKPLSAENITRLFQELDLPEPKKKTLTQKNAKV